MERPNLVNDDPRVADMFEQCRNGDREAMHLLYLAHQRRVFSVAMNYFGGNREMAEDVTQKVFVKLLTRFDFRGEAEFTTWLYRLTVNACTDEARKRNRFVDFTALFGLAGPLAAEVQQLMAERDEISNLVTREVACLRPKYRVPVVLKYVEGLSYNEIAEVMGCSPGTVASRLNRGLKKLESRLGHLRGSI